MGYVVSVHQVYVFRRTGVKVMVSVMFHNPNHVHVFLACRRQFRRLRRSW